MTQSFLNVDENVRGLAADVLAATLYRFSAQKVIVSDILKKELPRLNNDKKFNKWVDNLADEKLQDDDLKVLEERALCDAHLSIEYHAIECIGLIAGTTSDDVLGKDMIWKLIDLATMRPEMLLPCYKACRRAAFLLGFTRLSDMLEGMMPHLLVKWLESRRSLHEFPLLFMSPFAVVSACRSFPSEILKMLLQEGGWSDDYFRLGDGMLVEGGDEEGQNMNERLLSPFVESVGKL